MRRLSHVLLTIEAIFLVFLTFLAGVFLLGGSFTVWAAALTGQHFVDALAWTAVLLSLLAAWWLLLAYFYGGHSGARRVPAAVWVFAGLIALLALSDAVITGAPSPATLFVPTLMHLSLEVWVWPPDSSIERTREG